MVDLLKAFWGGVEPLLIVDAHSLSPPRMLLFFFFLAFFHLMVGWFVSGITQKTIEQISFET